MGRRVRRSAAVRFQIDGPLLVLVMTTGTEAVGGCVVSAEASIFSSGPGRTAVAVGPHQARDTRRARSKKRKGGPES